MSDHGAHDAQPERLQITVYGADWCPDCQRLTDNFLRQAIGGSGVDATLNKRKDVGPKIDSEEKPKFRKPIGMAGDIIPEIQIHFRDRTLSFSFECRALDDAVIIEHLTSKIKHADTTLRNIARNDPPKGRLLPPGQD